MSGHIMAFKGTLPTIADDCFIAPTATVIGDVVIGAGTSVWFNCVIRGDVHEIRIGERTNIQDGTVVHVTGGKLGTYIGSDITIGHGAILHACTLGDGCFIGMGAIILDGAVVEPGGVVAAGSLVTPGKRVGTGELWGGNPAKLMRVLSQEERVGFTVNAPGYVTLGQTYRGAQ
ncbi:MAG: gamma carbonic anhydrase family protein [Phaeospirillum sp.]|nr:gamma carbonic anhydrase family protein [Phaeospirillum sp.]